MAAMEGMEWTFDTVASKYEKLRLGYFCVCISLGTRENWI